MKPDLKLKWIENLESGKFIQGRTYLNTENINGNRYCCLGVLAETAIETGLPITKERYGDEWKYGISPYEVNRFTLTSSLAHDLGIQDQSCDLLVELNDVHEQNFTSIAEWIRDNIDEDPQ